jgi:hypothetical protein
MSGRQLRIFPEPTQIASKPGVQQCPVVLPVKRLPRYPYYKRCRAPTVLAQGPALAVRWHIRRWGRSLATEDDRPLNKHAAQELAGRGQHEPTRVFILTDVKEESHGGGT